MAFPQGLEDQDLAGLGEALPAVTKPLTPVAPEAAFPSSRRSNAFEVLALDGVRSGVLQLSTARDCADWLRAVSANIGHLMLQSVSTWSPPPYAPLLDSQENLLIPTSPGEGCKEMQVHEFNIAHL